MTQQGMKRVFLTKLTDSHASDKEGLGTVRREGDNEFIYLKAGDNSTNSGLMVHFGYDEDNVYQGKLAPVASIAAGRLAVAMTSFDADEYGWFQIRGEATGGAHASASTAKGDAVYLEGSGLITQTSASTDLVNGAVFTQAVNASSNGDEVGLMLNYPHL